MRNYAIRLGVNDVSDKKKFGDRLRLLRKKQALSQEELAEKIDVHLNTISRWENGIDLPKTTKVKKLAEVLQISEEELLNGAPEATWVLTVKIADDFTQEMIDMSKRMPFVSSITTTPQGGFLCLGGDYPLWTDDALFKKMISDMKKFRETVIQNGKAFGSIKE